MVFVLRFACLFLLLVPLSACSKKGSGGVGAACKTGSNCKSGLSCVPDLPGGMCTSECSQTACGDGQSCHDFGGANLCVPTCTDRSQCRSDYQCLDGVCVPPCSAPTDCAPRGFSCDNGQCTPLPGAADGASCSVDEDCSSQLCLIDTCRRACDSEAACPVDQTCAINAMGDNGELTPTTQIRPACIPRRGGATPGKACKVDGDCDQGTCQYSLCVNLCNSEAQCGSSGTCSDVPILLDSGTYPNVKLCLPSPSLLTFDTGLMMAQIPSTARSFSLFVSLQNTTDYENVAGIVGLNEPDGTEIYTVPQSEADLYAALLRYYPTEISSTMTVPNSPAYTLKQGVYSYQAGSSKGGPLDVTGYLKVSKDPITTGSLQLNFYVTDLSGGACNRARVTASSGASSLSSAIQDIKDIYAAAGITIDKVTFQSSTANNSVTRDAASDLGQVLEAGTSGHSTKIGMDIVLVRGISSGSDPNLVTLGVAGGIPSAPVLGNPHSGVVVAMDAVCDYSAGEWQFVLASTIAHEAGHSFGLFHNVEQTGSKDAITDNNSDGASNLMYWLEYGGTKLSAQQGEVVRHDPKVTQ